MGTQAQVTQYIKLKQITGQTKFTHLGQKPKARQNSMQKPVKMRPKIQYVLKNEKAEKYCTNEGITQTHTNPIK